tara:strand:- start:47 stop:346 length:300 start_codon:yes stop_codon:yes gene_type:complete
LINEVEEHNKKGESFDVVQSVFAQLSFFACVNVFHDDNIYKNIQRYSYCKDMSVPPFEGDYGQQPALWVDTYFCIKHILAKKESQQLEKIKARNKSKGI